MTIKNHPLLLLDDPRNPHRRILIVTVFIFFVRDGEIKKISFKKVKIEEFSSDLSLQGPLTKKETKKLKLKQKKKNRM